MQAFQRDKRQEVTLRQMGETTQRISGVQNNNQHKMCPHFVVIVLR